jgi:hypothetical protein
MTTTLTKLPGSKWFIETDDVTFQIVGEYNKVDITNQIASLKATLATYPDPTQEQADIVDLLAVIAGKWTPVKNARIVALINVMWGDYQGDPRSLEAVAVQSEIDRLKVLKDRLV